MDLLLTIRSRRRRWLLAGLLDGRAGTTIWALSTGLFYLALRAVWSAGRGREGLANVAMTPNSAICLGLAFLAGGLAMIGVLALSDPHWAEGRTDRRTQRACWRRRMWPLAVGSVCNLLGTAGLVLISPLADATVRSEAISLTVGLAGVLCLAAALMRGQRYRARHSRNPHQEAWNSACGYFSAGAGLAAGLGGYALFGWLI
ncbi:MAG: hypothetical protein ACLFUJ_11720 [Phycisphaerae bacterium]